MTIQLRLMLMIASIASMLFLMNKIRNFKLQIEYAIFWVLFSVMLIVLAVFPHIAYFLAKILGFQSPSNMIFLFIIALLLIKVFMMTIELDVLDKKLKELIQTIALKENESKSKDSDEDIKGK